MVQVATPLDICRNRGDTFPFVITIQDASGAVDITGSTFKLTVDPEPDPVDSSANLFQLTGAIVVPATNGQVSFEPNATQADQDPDVYFYDIEWTDAATKIRTIAKGQWVVQQDITKV